MNTTSNFSSTAKFFEVTSLTSTSIFCILLRLALYKTSLVTSLISNAIMCFAFLKAAAILNIPEPVPKSSTFNPVKSSSNIYLSKS